MGLWDSIKAGVSWLVDKILRPVIEWITEAIQAVVDQLRIWKHKALEKLAEWLENDFFFLAAVAATIVVAVLWPKILAGLKELAVTVLLKKVWEKVKEGLASVMDFIHILDLQLINSILTVIWPQWRDLVGQLSDAMGALSEELRQGVAGFNAYFGVVRSMSYMKNAFLGTDPELGELEAFEETSAFLQRANDRFADYTRNPGHIMRDIIEEIYIPYAGTLRDAQQSQVESIRDNYDRVLDVEESVRSFELSLEGFRAQLPEELERFAVQRLDPFITELDRALNLIETEVLPKIGSVVLAIEKRAAYQDAINQRIVREMRDTYGFMLNYYQLPAADQENLERLLAELVGIDRDREADEFAPPILGRMDQALQSAQVPFSGVAIMPSLGYEPAGAFRAAVSAAEREKDWYVGEW